MRKVLFKSNKGFTTVEALLAGAIFVLLAASIFGVIFYGEQTIAVSGQVQRATMLAEEGLEAARNIRDQNFANLQDGNYGLVQANGSWSLQSGGDIQGIFTRVLTITTIDSNTKEVQALIFWNKTPQRSTAIGLVTRLTNWASQQNWVVPTRGTCLNISGGQDAQKIDLNGNYAHLVTDSASSSFVAVNVSNPDAPVQGGALSLQNNPKNIFVSGNYAYVGSRNNSQELQIINITNPGTPTLQGSFDASGNSDGNGVFVVGTTAYIVRDVGSEEFHAINVTNPGAPTQNSQLDLNSTANEIYVAGSYAFIASASDTQELQVVSLSGTPSLVASLNLSGTADALSIAGYSGYVVIGRTDGQLHVVNVSTPLAPQLVGTYNAGGQINDIDIGMNSTRTFLATQNSTAEFQVVDLTNPSSLSRVGAYDAPGTLNGVRYSATQNITYVVGSSNAGNFCAIKPQ